MCAIFVLYGTELWTYSLRLPYVSKKANRELDGTRRAPLCCAAALFSCSASSCMFMFSICWNQILQLSGIFQNHKFKNSLTQFGIWLQL